MLGSLSTHTYGLIFNCLKHFEMNVIVAYVWCLLAPTLWLFIVRLQLHENKLKFSDKIHVNLKTHYRDMQNNRKMLGKNLHERGRATSICGCVFLILTNMCCDLCRVFIKYFRWHRTFKLYVGTYICTSLASKIGACRINLVDLLSLFFIYKNIK